MLRTVMLLLLFVPSFCLALDDQYLGLLPRVTRAVTAYNYQDSEAFFAEFLTAEVKQAKKDSAFESLYAGQYYSRFGKILGIEPLAKLSILSAKRPMIVFDAQSEKLQACRLSVVFMRDDDHELKIFEFKLSK